MLKTFVINPIYHHYDITFEPGLFREQMSCWINDLIRIKKLFLKNSQFQKSIRPHYHTRTHAHFYLYYRL